MKWCIDRIENNDTAVVVVNGKTLNIPLSFLPTGVKESDIISVNIDKTDVANREKRINNLMDNLFKWFLKHLLIHVKTGVIISGISYWEVL